MAIISETKSQVLKKLVMFIINSGTPKRALTVGTSETELRRRACCAAHSVTRLVRATAEPLAGEVQRRFGATAEPRDEITSVPGTILDGEQPEDELMEELAAIDDEDAGAMSL